MTQRHLPAQVCILSQKDDLVVEALSVDSLGSGIKVTCDCKLFERYAQTTSQAMCPVT